MVGMRKDRYVTLTRDDMVALQKGFTVTKDIDKYGIDRVVLAYEESTEIKPIKDVRCHKCSKEFLHTEQLPEWDERRIDI